MARGVKEGEAGGDVTVSRYVEKGAATMPSVIIGACPKSPWSTD